MISTLFLQNLIRAVGLHSLSFCAKNECKSVFLIFYTRENQFPENVFTNTLKSICERKKDYINTGKSFSASLGLWVGSEAITPISLSFVRCVCAEVLKEFCHSLHGVFKQIQAVTPDIHSWLQVLRQAGEQTLPVKTPNEYMSIVYPMSIGHIKATPLRSLCKPTLCPWNICQFEPLCSS